MLAPSHHRLVVRLALAFNLGNAAIAVAAALYMLRPGPHIPTRLDGFVFGVGSPAFLIGSLVLTLPVARERVLQLMLLALLLLWFAREAIGGARMTVIALLGYAAAVVGLFVWWWLGARRIGPPATPELGAR